MSTPTGPPPRALFAGLIDDAAVFPPGSFPVDEAIRRRAARRGEPYADLVGPLLLSPDLVGEALESALPLTIAVVGRPSVPLPRVINAASLVLDSHGHSLAGVEVGYADDWRRVLEAGVPVSVELTATQATGPEMADLARGGLEQVQAKLRTGATPANPVPSPAELAAFIEAAIGHEVAFKLTGGMHRAISHRASTAGGGEDQFGFLNVLLAVDELAHGGSTATAIELLQERDAKTVVALVREIDGQRAARIRNAFHSYGCCDVLDPIHDLDDLDLLETTR